MTAFDLLGVALAVALILCLIIGKLVGEGKDGFYNDWR